MIETTIPAGWCSFRRSWHFQRRLWEHYGVSLRYGEFTAIVAAIRSGNAAQVGRQRYKVQLRCGVWIKVIVGKQGLPVTTVPWGREVLK